MLASVGKPGRPPRRVCRDISTLGEHSRRTLQRMEDNVSRRAVIGWVVMIMVAGLSAGCSAESSPGSADQPASQQGTAPAPTEAPSQPQPSDTPEFRQLDEKELTAALLELEAFPAGWSEDSTSSEPSKSKFCGAKPKKGDLIAERDFQKGDGFSAEVATVGLSQYASATEASVQFEKYQDGMKTCKSEKVSGDTVKYAIVNTVDVGYPSFGFKVTADTYGVIINVAQVGPTLVQVGSGGIMSVDADLPSAMLPKQVNSYVAAAS